MGSVMIEENVVSAAGTTHRTSTEELVHLIRALGKTPCSATRCTATSEFSEPPDVVTGPAARGRSGSTPPYAHPVTARRESGTGRGNTA